MNTIMNKSTNRAYQHAPSAWGAVFSMALGVVVLIASEFMPVSLLTPIAQDLGISQGSAGQAISVSGMFAVVTSLLNTPSPATGTGKKC